MNMLATIKHTYVVLGLILICGTSGVHLCILQDKFMCSPFSFSVALKNNRKGCVSLWKRLTRDWYVKHLWARNLPGWKDVFIWSNVIPCANLLRNALKRPSPECICEFACWPMKDSVHLLPDPYGSRLTLSTDMAAAVVHAASPGQPNCHTPQMHK